MSAASSSTHVYAASTNPPRRAKRKRPLTENSDDDDSPPVSTVRPILPRTTLASKPFAPLSPSVSPKATRAIGNGERCNLSRAQRESLRKQNHSRIEKARRTKINDALAELRVLVPKDLAPTLIGEEEEENEDDDSEDDGNYAGAQNDRRQRQNKPKQEKEFKLEVLVRTVGYLKTLICRVNALEQAAAMPSPCTLCSGMLDNIREGAALPRKRQRLSRSRFEEDSDVDMDVSRSSSLERKLSSGRRRPQQSFAGSKSNTPSESTRPSPRLPPISTWLPLLPYSDPSAIPSAPPSSKLAPLVIPTQTPYTEAARYPSPPSSDTLLPRPTAAPPALALPPAHSLSVDQDSDAASLLLRLRAPSLGSSNPTMRPFAQTPSSLLGLGR